MHFDILQWRRQMGLSRLELGRRLGISPAQLRKYERGAVPIPRKVVLACATIYLGLDDESKLAAFMPFK